MVKHVAQTILLEVEVVHLDVGNSYIEHNSQMNHAMEPVEKN